MKKILIISPIIDYGGREVEVNIIAKSLMSSYDVTILSTNNATDQSEALKGLENVVFKTIDQEVFKQYVSLRLLTFLSYLWNGKKKIIHFYLKNNLMEKFFRLKRLKTKVLKKNVCLVDIVWMVADFESPLFVETIQFCKEKSIPCILRTTRTIFEIPMYLLDKLKNISLFVHHSERNAQNLSAKIEHKYAIVDQCALNEKSLLSLQIKTGNTIRYGFLGRLTDNKQIMLLIDFFKNCKNLFYIAGEGIYRSSIIDIEKQNKNIKYLGHLEQSTINFFFDKIDVLILPSIEESGPLVGIEAMAAGKIIVSTNVGAMAERLVKSERTFWLKKDLSNLTDIFLEIDKISKKDLDKLKECNRLIYTQNYSIDKIQEQYLTITNEFKNK